MAKVNPYLNFNGNTEEVFNFYKSVFGGEFDMVMRFKDTPEEFQSPGDDPDKIMHISLPIGKETWLMGSDVPSSFPPATHGSGSFISITAESEAEAKKIFDALSAGGNVVMPLSNAFWGSLFGMLNDKYGIQWMMSFDNQTKK